MCNLIYENFLTYSVQVALFLEILLSKELKNGLLLQNFHENLPLYLDSTIGAYLKNNGEYLRLCKNPKSNWKSISEYIFS